jgi:ADP-heptose:LPS heptosyltransferase
VGYAEVDVVDRLLPLLKDATPLVAANWPLLPTAALIAQATVFVGHDSGLTHLAAALGRRTVAIFGPTDPEIWGPRGEHVTIVQRGRDAGSQHNESSGRGTPSQDNDDVHQVLEGVRRGLVSEGFTQNPGDRSGQL